MILASIADTHARGKDLEAFDNQLHSSLETAIDRDAEALFVAGDLFDNHNIAASGRSVGDIVSVVKSAFLSYTNRLPIYVIPGQHDKENESSRDALTVLEGIENITVIRSPRKICFNDRDRMIAVDCVPWMYQESAFEAVEAIRRLDTVKAYTNILCAHLRVLGARQNSGHVCSRGSFSLSSAQLLSLGYDRIWLGDFHERQDVANGRGGYVGALRQLSFAYVGQLQGFELYNTSTGVAEFVEINEAPRHEILFWEKDTPRPEPTPGFRTRTKTLGWVATDLDRINEGEEIIYDVQSTKKSARLDFDPTDAVLESPSALLDLYIDQKQVVVTDRVALHELLNELLP